MSWVGKNDTLLFSVSSSSTPKNTSSSVNSVRCKGSLKTVHFTPSVYQNFPLLGFILRLWILLKYKCSKAGFKLKPVSSTWNPKGMTVSSLLEWDLTRDKEKTFCGLRNWGIGNCSLRSIIDEAGKDLGPLSSYVWMDIFLFSPENLEYLFMDWNKAISCYTNLLLACFHPSRAHVFIYLEILFLLDKFKVYKIEREVEKFPICPFLPHIHSLPYYHQHSPEWYTFYLGWT